VIRAATPADAEVIAGHRRAMFVDMGVDAAKVQAMHGPFLSWVRDALASGAYLGYLKELEGGVVAGAGMLLYEFPPSPVTPGTRRAYLLNVYTLPQYRGRGLAAEVVRAALSDAAARGAWTVTLHASEAGRGVYERLGFRSTNEMRLVVEDARAPTP